MGEAGIAMDIEDIGQAPAHPSRFDGVDDFHIFWASNDVGGHDDEEFGAAFSFGIEAEEGADEWDAGEEGDPARAAGAVLGDETGEDDGLAIEGGHAGLSEGSRDDGGADDFAVRTEADGDAGGFLADGGAFDGDVHEDHPILVGARLETHQKPDASVFGVDSISVDPVGDAGHAGDLEADLNEGFDVVDGHDLRSGEELDAIGILEGSEEDVDRIAGGGEDEASVAEILVGASQSEGAQTVGSDFIGTAGGDVIGQRAGDIEAGGGEGTAGGGASVEVEGILETEFSSEFEGIGEFDFGQEDLDHDEWWSAIEAFDDFADLFGVARRGADDEAVGGGFGHDEDFAIDLFGGDGLIGEEDLVDGLSLLGEEVLNRGRDVGSIAITEPDDFGGSVLDSFFIETPE